MKNYNKIEISIIKGDKLFNQNTPFAINLSSPENEDTEKKCNADIICVIDISGSMTGEKIFQVKESLKKLLTLMDEKDRICIILFNDFGKKYYDLNYMTKENKNILVNEIDKIYSGGGTNILSGLQLAVEVLKKECNNEKSVSSILLLSDGHDNFSNDLELADSLKKLTKGFGLSFTLNTFGYGNDHDPKIMNKLANIRDGSFFYVENYSKITEYFVSILGGCISVISKKVDLSLNVISDKCKIIEVYGKDNLFSHESNEISFKTTMLQFICGKEYTFVLEIFIDESKVQIDEEILKTEIIYEDISQDNKIVKKEKRYNYKLKDIDYLKANEEYIRVYVYHVLDEAMKLKDTNQFEKGKKKLNDMEKWILDNYKGNNKNYIEDIQKAKGLFSKNDYEKRRSLMLVNSSIQENAFKRTGQTMSFRNSYQTKMLNIIKNDFQNQMAYSKPVGVTQNVNFIGNRMKYDLSNQNDNQKKNKLINNNQINYKLISKKSDARNSFGPKLNKSKQLDKPNINQQNEDIY